MGDAAQRWKTWIATPALLWIAALLIWTAVTVPLAAGRQTFFLRDAFDTHLHFKAFGVEELRHGRVPATDPVRALGQPFRGNPNALPLYPGNLLYLVLPFWSAFNLHFALHWLGAFFAMWLLARELGQGPTAAVAAGITYAGSGWMLSGLTFYNLVVVSAWWPVVLWGMVRGGRRGIALGGLACGLAFLGGEPITLALGLVPLALLAWRRHGPTRGLLALAALGGVAVLVALPQLVATWRILPFTFRGGHGFLPVGLDTFSFHPWRLLELVVPFPWGSVDLGGPRGFWPTAAVPRPPFVLSVHFGIVGLALAALGGGRRRWLLLAAAGLAAAWLGGVFAEQLWWLSGGRFRTPERFLFWFALATPLLVGWGLESLDLSPPQAARRRARAVALVGLLLLVAGAAVWTLADGFVAAAASRSPAAAAGVERHAEQWLVALAAGGALLLGLAAGVARGRALPAAALQLVSLLALAPIVLTDEVDAYRRPATWAARLPPGAGVVPVRLSEDAPGLAVDAPTQEVERAWAAALGSSVSLLWGLEWPLAPDSEGLYSARHESVDLALGDADWPARLAWYRILGVDATVMSRPVADPGLELLDRRPYFGLELRLYAVPGATPRLWWPAEVEAIASPEAAFRRLSGLADPLATAVAAMPVAHRPGARVRLLREEPDRLEVEVAGEGGVLAVRRSYFPLWRARSGETELRVFPLDLVLIGVEVPPGERTVVLEISAWPEVLAGGVAVVAALAALLVAIPRSRRAAPSPGPRPSARRAPAPPPG